ncbi:iron ABC transporter permease [Agrobacterium sp.]|uniref:iron ABC transporter permease n=1 Tax=Agrobacterium sp. TaxID=361 RepID=UPI0028AE1554|nr:iron ABC transporter permease [Agrobacterium sp.]
MKVSRSRIRPVLSICAWPIGLCLLLMLALVDFRIGSKLVAWSDVLAFPSRPATLAQTVLETIRAPRLIAAIFVGAALAVAGSVFQSVLRNPLAAPDILSVTSGAQLFLVVSTLLLPAVIPPIIATTSGAAVGAVFCIALAGGFRASPGRLALAGVATSLCFVGIASAIILLADDRASGLLLWTAGILDQTGWSKILTAGPAILLSFAGLMLIARQLDLLVLGEQTSASLGVTRATTLTGLTAGVVLAGAAVTLAGPIGFIGLAVPNALRALGITRHHRHLPLAALWGANALLFADVITQVLVGNGVTVPTGIAVASLGAPAMLLLLRTTKAGGEGRMPTPSTARRLRASLLFTALGITGLMLVVAALMIGDGVSSSFDAALANLDLRAPRLIIALGCGAILAAAGVVLQAVTRNPLCGPETLGLSQGAALFSLVALLAGLSPGTPIFQMVTIAGAMSAVLLLMIFGPGRSPQKLILAGIAIAASFGAISTIIVVEARLQTAQALSWLSGSTHGRGYGDAAAMVPWLLVVTMFGLFCSRQLDALVLGDEKARALGVETGRGRIFALIYAAVATAIAVSTIGAVGFIGLLAPHAARLIAGPRHARNLPVAMAIGAILMATADLVGRSIIAPLELPAGIITAVVGAPFFMLLMRPPASRKTSVS